MKKAFMSLKFHDASDGIEKVEADKKKVDALTEALRAADIENVVMVRDVEKYGEVELPKGAKLMIDYAFPAMRECDMLVVEFSEKGVGLGIGAGFAYGIGLPIYVIAKTGSDISLTMSNLAEEVIFYDKYEDITEAFKNILAREKFELILASKSKLRKEMLTEAGYEFSVVVSNADETPNENYCIADQMIDIARKKAFAVFKETQDRGRRIIVAADQNIFFEGELYGKPKTIDEARELLKRMRGKDDICAFTGNCVIAANGSTYMFKEECFDQARMRMDKISDEVLEDYLANGAPLTKCGGICILDTPFLHLVHGDMTTAKGMTMDPLLRMLKKCKQIPRIFEV